MTCVACASVRQCPSSVVLSVRAERRVRRGAHPRARVVARHDPDARPGALGGGRLARLGEEVPGCRWSHGPIEAALGLRSRLALEPDRIARIRVRTFAAAATLARRHPATTEQAQYSLVWPIAASLAHGTFDVAHVLAPAFEHPVARRLASTVEVDPSFEEAFPVRRFAELEGRLTDGAAHRSGATEAPGEPDDLPVGRDRRGEGPHVRRRPPARPREASVAASRRYDQGYGECETGCRSPAANRSNRKG
jgi:hypothetical protein